MSLEREAIAPLKKRESRAGLRKVNTLTADQLERKRANDREAQRTIRQRTKEHIESLENQVAALKAKGDQFDDLARRYVALQDENSRLRHQLAMLPNRLEGYSDNETERPSSITSAASIAPSSHYSGRFVSDSVPRAPPSVPSASSRVSFAPDWQSYGSTRSPSICESLDKAAEYSHKSESYTLEGQLQAPQITSLEEANAPIPMWPNPLSLNVPGDADASLQSFSHHYPPSRIHQGPSEELQQNAQQLPSPQAMGQAQRNPQFPYPWVPQG